MTSKGREWQERTNVGEGEEEEEEEEEDEWGRGGIIVQQSCKLTIFIFIY